MTDHLTAAVPEGSGRRWIVPGLAVLSLARDINAAFDALSVLVAAIQAGHPDLKVPLEMLHLQMSKIYETLIVVVSEQPAPVPAELNEKGQPYGSA